MYRVNQTIEVAISVVMNGRKGCFFSKRASGLIDCEAALVDSNIAASRAEIACEIAEAIFEEGSIVDVQTIYNVLESRNIITEDQE